MNQSQAKEWLPLIKALADGKVIQLNICNGENPIWRDAKGILVNNDTIGMYRIKPEPKKQSYRVGLFKNEQEYFAMLCSDSDSEGKYFVRWLTDRIEYELPEDFALMCNKCGVDRSKSQCRGNLHSCPMVATAHTLPEGKP